MSNPPLLDPVEFRQRTAASGAVAFAARSVQGVFALATALLMARLLTPGDFGVFAMVMPPTILGMVAANTCIQSAILQHPHAREADLQRYYRFARAVAIGAALTMGGIGPLLARFYGEPRVTRAAIALAVVVALMPRAALQEAQLKRELRFPLVHGVQLGTWFLGMTAGVVGAWLGLGYWALPLQVIVMETLRIAAMGVVSGWRPRPLPSTGGDGAALRRSWLSLFGLRLATWLNEQPDLVAVGRLGGSPVLGIYDTARRWAWYPFEEPYLALTEVAIASLGRVRDDAQSFRRLVTRFVLGMLTVSLPVVAFVVAAADTVVHVLLGSQWDAAIPFLRVLGIAAFAGIVTRTTAWILLARGETTRLVRWSLTVQAPAVLAAALVGSARGAMGVATAVATMAVVLMLPAIHYIVRGTPVSPGDVLRAAARPAGASLGAALLVLVLSDTLPGGVGVASLVARLAVYLPSFGVLWLALPGGVRETRELLATIRALWSGRGAGESPPP